MTALVGKLASWLDRSSERGNEQLRGVSSLSVQDTGFEESSGAPPAREVLGYLVIMLPPF
jgi:hypothetical protein